MLKHRSSQRRKPASKPKAARKLNRRLSSQKVAKRKSRIKRPPLHKVAWALLSRPVKTAGAMAAVGLVLLAGWSLLVMSPAFALQEARVHGTKHLSRMEVLQAAGLSAADSLITLKMGPIESRIGRMPWVKQVSVERDFPHSVRIIVAEREVRMLALAGGRIFVLDENIRPIAALGRREAPDLPWLSGLSPADLVKPDDEILRLMDAAGRLLDALAKSSLGRPSEIRIDRVWGLSLVTDRLAATVRLGFGDYALRLKTLTRLLADLKSRGELERVTLIDIEEEGRVKVRLGREAT